MRNAEKSTVLAQQYGWSLAFANGYADGEASRRRQASIPVYIRVAKDEYAEGFRAAFFGRQFVAPNLQSQPATIAGKPAVQPVPIARAA